MTIPELIQKTEEMQARANVRGMLANKEGWGRHRDEALEEANTLQEIIEQLYRLEDLEG